MWSERWVPYGWQRSEPTAAGSSVLQRCRRTASCSSPGGRKRTPELMSYSHLQTTTGQPAAALPLTLPPSLSHVTTKSRLPALSGSSLGCLVSLLHTCGGGCPWTDNRWQSGPVFESNVWSLVTLLTDQYVFAVNGCTDFCNKKKQPKSQVHRFH